MRALKLLLTLMLPLNLLAQQSHNRFPFDPKLIIIAQEQGHLYQLYPENGEGQFADIALQDSFGRVYYLNNKEHYLSMYQGDSLKWKCDFNNHHISFLNQLVGSIALLDGEIFLACHPCTAVVNRKSGVLTTGGCD